MFGSIPLGWLQLKAQKLRLVAAIMGIAFAVILIFVQLEFREALFVSAVRYHAAMDYDLAMLSPKTDFMVSSKQFPRTVGAIRLTHRMRATFWPSVSIPRNPDSNACSARSNLRQ
jgi:hypothetical protein